MDSLSLYESFCGNGSSVKKEEKYAQVDQMIACIYKEVFEPPFEMVRSPFLCKTADMLNRRKKKKTALAGERVLSVFDAYVIGQQRYRIIFLNICSAVISSGEGMRNQKNRSLCI